MTYEFWNVVLLINLANGCGRKDEIETNQPN